MTAELKQELNEVLDSYHYTNYEKTFLSTVEKIMHSWRANHDEVPQLTQDSVLLKIKIKELSDKFNIVGDVELDQGYSFSY